jgi:hypothetical protein
MLEKVMTQNSQANDDIALSAYLDGELPQDEADRLSERLAVEPLLARRLESMRASDDATRGLFANLDAMPMPPGVLDLLQEKSAPRETSNVVPFPTRVARQFFQVPVAVAASVALLAGFLVHDLLQRTSTVGDDLGATVAGKVTHGTELYELLESGVSAETELLAAGTRGRLLLTFQDATGDYCRQLELSSDIRSVQVVACRRTGDWQMEALEFGPAATADGQYQPASRGSAPAVDAAIDALIGTNEPLDAEAESRLVKGGWKKIEE